jgi:hypothetical protein
MTKLIKLPKAFFIDHKERDLDTPKIAKETKANIWVSAEDPYLAELKSDAAYYSDMADMGAWDKYLFGLVRSAKATLKAIEEA